MRRQSWALALAAGLVLAGCEAGGDKAGNASEGVGNEAAATEATAPGNETAAAGTTLQGCPFQATTDWIGSSEQGHVRINGRVDLQMAGFRPTLTEREGSGGGTLRLDLALAPEPNAAVSDAVRFERPSGPTYRRAEIWCGGEQIESFDLTVVE